MLVVTLSAKLDDNIVDEPLIAEAFTVAVIPVSPAPLPIKDEADIMFDLENDIIEQLKLDYMKEGGKGQSFTDWLKSKPKSYFKSIPLQMASGGKVVMLSDYLKQKEKPKIKKLNLDSVAIGKSLSELTEAERAAVNKLLRLTFGKGD